MSVFSPKRKADEPQTSTAEKNANKNYVAMVDEMLTMAISKRASDIHLEPYFSNGEKARVRFRIDGVLQSFGVVDRESYLGMITRIKVMAKMNITEKRLPQDGKFIIPQENIDVRVSSIPDIRGEKLVLRLLSSINGSADIHALGLTSSQMAMVSRITDRKRGLLLVCGPTGCGKSTTLYAILKELSGIDINITTIEDPVEINMNGITQVQLQESIGLTYEEALKSIMRQDPDVMMVGEIRDPHVAAEAVRFAMTGHQVLTTLHTVNAFGSVKRMLEMGVEPYLLADVLEGVIAQRLVRRLCPYCKKSTVSGEKEKALWGIKEGTTLYEPVGCPHCGNTGYYDRIGVFELLTVNEDLRKVIIAGKDLSAVPVDHQHFIPFSWSMKNLILQGITGTEEGVRIFGTEIISENRK